MLKKKRGGGKEKKKKERGKIFTGNEQNEEIAVPLRNRDCNGRKKNNGWRDRVNQVIGFGGWLKNPPRIQLSNIRRHRLAFKHYL